MLIKLKAMTGREERMIRGHAIMKMVVDVTNKATKRMAKDAKKIVVSVLSQP